VKKSPADIVRCPWGGIEDALYARYHDTEWGVPYADDVKMFEKMTLEGFQSGLSWLTILRKRENFRRAFDGFDPDRIAGYGEADVVRLMADAGIVRNKLKIEAAISNARAYVALRETRTLAGMVWSVVDGHPLSTPRRAMGDVPAETPQSKTLSKLLKSHGFRFVGPTTMYAFMQSAGLVNDHLTTCHRHDACAKLQKAFKLPKEHRT
jgi:DNA-3-methyladenine glycosylase I